MLGVDGEQEMPTRLEHLHGRREQCWASSPIFPLVPRGFFFLRSLVQGECAQPGLVLCVYLVLAAHFFMVHISRGAQKGEQTGWKKIYSLCQQEVDC